MARSKVLLEAHAAMFWMNVVGVSSLGKNPNREIPNALNILSLFASVHG